MGKQGEESVDACQAAPLRKQSHKKENQGDMEKDEGRRTKERERRPLKFPKLIDNLDVRRLEREVGYFARERERASQILG